MKTVLFICRQNACRSQMAEAFFNAAPPPGWRALSAGSEPAKEVNPKAVEVMKEAGMDMSGARPRLLTLGVADVAERTICLCVDACPFLPGRKVEHWEIEDPAGKPGEVFRRVREEIRARVKALVNSLGSR